MRRDHEASVVLLEVPKDLEGELDRAFELEAAGWKGEAGTAIDSTKETALFYRSVASAYHRLGELRLSTIALDGELAAFDLCLLHSGRVWTLKTSYNESYPRLSPGNVLLLLEIERSFELGLEAVELLGGFEDYKLDPSRPASATTFDFAPTVGVRAPWLDSRTGAGPGRCSCTVTGKSPASPNRLARQCTRIRPATWASPSRLRAPRRPAA